MGQATVYGPDPITLQGRLGSRYWIEHPFAFTGHAEVDARLSAYPVAVFQPPGRAPHETPTLLALQGLAAPCQWNGFLVPTLLDMGIACVLFDTPLGGERSLTRNHQGDVISEALALRERGFLPPPALVPAMMEAVARDFGTVLHLSQERHGLRDGRRALFGVSWGTLLCAYAFTKYGVGTRLLGTVGHADLCRFARSYAPRFTPLLVSRPGRLLGKLASLCFGRIVDAALDFLAVLREIHSGSECARQADPMTYRGQVHPDRRVRFLVGQEDRLVKPADALHCARQFPDGDCYAVPGLGHGGHSFGPSFVEHVRYFLGTQLGDWKW